MKEDIGKCTNARKQSIKKRTTATNCFIAGSIKIKAKAKNYFVMKTSIFIEQTQEKDDVK